MTYHSESVGSFRRPLYLLEARKKKERSEISAEELRNIEDAAIKEVVEKQVASGLKVVSDGEYRRDNFFLDFLCGLNGVKGRTLNWLADAYKNPKYEEEGWQFPPQVLKNRLEPYAYGKVSANSEHPEYYGFKYLKSVTPPGIIPKVIVPSPIYLTIRRNEADPYPTDVYSNVEEFYKDISQAYLDTFLKFYELGARLIQIDDPAIPINSYLISADRNEQFQALERNISIYLKLLKPVIAALPSDLSVIIHLCRGNGLAHFRVPFTYHDFLPLFSELKPQPKYLILEWDDERSGTLDALKEYNESLPNTTIILGFVSTKTPTVESEEYVIGKIKEASQYIPLSRLGISPQCGFGTSKEGSPQCSDEVQWGKIRLVAELGRKLWGDK